MNWYYDAGAGQRKGPISDSELQSLLDSGTINPSTLVWREGMTDWAPLAQARTAAAPTDDGDTQRCDSCGNFVPPSQLIQIGPRRICASCKPAVVQQIQSGAALPDAGLLERTGPAWEQREQTGTVNAAWETIKAVLMKPEDAFRSMKREGGLTSPLIYTLLLSTIGNLAGLIYNLGFNLGLGAQNPQMTELIEPLRQNPSYAVAAVIGAAIALPIATIFVTFVHAGILHLSLMICSGAKQPFETTFRVACYSSGSSNILQVIPFCGAMVAGLWGLIVCCIGIAKTHEISTTRAVVAVLLPTVVCCIGFMVVIGAVVGMTAAASGH